MMPMNYAILKLFEDGQTYDADSVMFALQDNYAGFRAFKKANVVESLMAAEKNDLLEQASYDLDELGELHIYYRATEYGASMIKSYIK
ncbi:MAG: hypothetical protein LBG68_03235 [Coriobacteriales bacterium]|jgi:hypothetical protein|nr:hypothetical protein [Coriobacteriales bacterium]